MIRDTTFPPDGSEGVEKGVELEIKPEYAYAAGVGGEVGGVGTISQHLKWQAHMVSSWMDLCDGALQDM